MKNQKRVEKSLFSMELPIIGAVMLVYTATVFLQNTHNWNLKSVISFTILITLHIGMYLFREQIFKNSLWLYLLIQGILIFILSVLIKENYQAAYLGLIPLIMAQSIHLLKDRRKIIYAILYYYIIYIIPHLLNKGHHNVLYSISLLMLISSAIVTYGYLYTKQVRAHEKAQRLLFELEGTYDKLEEVTRESERQKLARDIHDTLSQGLVGVLMKLEALDMNLEKGNIDNSKEITIQAMNYVRANLKEARAIIQELRLQHTTSKNLGFGIEKEIQHFSENSNIDILINWNGSLEVSDIIYKNISFIVREILSNIEKHAKATKVIINISLDPDNIVLRIEDNGIGFDYDHFNRLYGHYGIIGLKERAKVIGGYLTIDSQKKRGTCVTVIVSI